MIQKTLTLFFNVVRFYHVKIFVLRKENLALYFNNIMRCYRVITFILCNVSLVILFCLISVNVFAATPKKIINIQHWKTKSSGVGVYFVATPNLPMLDIRVVFAAGSAYDTNELGLATLTNSLIGEGTTAQNANQIAKSFDRIGAQFNTNVDRDKATVSLRTLSGESYLNPALKEFIEVLSKMSFKPPLLQRVKNQTIAAIRVAQQSVGDVAKIAFYKTIYGNQPYAHDPLGTVSSVKAISAMDIKRFYRRYYTAKNAKIILVGDLTKKQAQRIANHIAKSLPVGKAAPRLLENKPLQHTIHRHIQFPTKQTAIVMGQLGIRRSNPDYFPLMVGNYVFGGLPLGSVLFQKVRNKRGLAYYVGSAFQPLYYRGPFIIQLKTRVATTKEALSVVQNALAEFLKQGPTQQQLNAAKQNLIGRFPLEVSSNGDIARVVTTIAFYHRPLDYLDYYVRSVRAVTPEKVKAAFSKAIDPKWFAIVTAGPKFSK